ncbi:Core-2/I-branching beta-1,6-N-acetylglucosaminyltransferase familyprotein [Zostera marina]|uniref:Core-2/I-branching beta-1,6-N-acetylglucosaminyltransferase familyprotein n=1 Tax=Zostera marina TaxID=29655 RepID=A0A0K9P8P9_ZOSMR|nr:Core-2/I-branching beta-1,6-N-acetylglucosaminyltransferase familyprotein [Zostera marina]
MAIGCFEGIFFLASMQVLNRVSGLENGETELHTWRQNQNLKPIRFFLQKRLCILLCFFFLIGVGAVLFGIHMVQTSSKFLPTRKFWNNNREATKEEDNGSLSTWINTSLSMSSLMHTMNDTQLLWRSTFASRIKEYPFQRMPKIAFMFLTRGPLPLRLLWEKFFDAHQSFYSIYIHSLPGYIPDFPVSSPFYQRQIPSQEAKWGEMSMSNAEKRLLANALLDISNECFILLSESCIPLRNFTTVYNYLMEFNRSFLHPFDDQGPDGRGRYHPGLLPEVNISYWRKGSQWFEVNREVAIEIVKDTKYYPKFEKFCKPRCYNDEHYFPTMLYIEKPNLLTNRSITYVNWSRRGSHPATFGGNDISDVFLKKIIDEQSCEYNGNTTHICFLFARKFAPSSLDPLLRLAPQLFWY